MASTVHRPQAIKRSILFRAIFRWFLCYLRGRQTFVCWQLFQPPLPPPLPSPSSITQCTRSVFTSTKCVALKPVDIVTFPGIYAHMSVVHADTTHSHTHIHIRAITALHCVRDTPSWPPSPLTVHCSYKSHHDIIKIIFVFFVCFWTRKVKNEIGETHIT